MTANLTHITVQGNYLLKVMGQKICQQNIIVTRIWVNNKPVWELGHIRGLEGWGTWGEGGRGAGGRGRRVGKGWKMGVTTKMRRLTDRFITQQLQNLLDGVSRDFGEDGRLPVLLSTITLFPSVHVFCTNTHTPYYHCELQRSCTTHPLLVHHAELQVVCINLTWSMFTGSRQNKLLIKIRNFRNKLSQMLTYLHKASWKAGWLTCLWQGKSCMTSLLTCHKASSMTYLLTCLLADLMTQLLTYV